MIAGVCRLAGISTSIRRSCVSSSALTIFGGAGILLYCIAWLTIPDEGQVNSAASDLLKRDPQVVMFVGLILAAAVAGMTMMGTLVWSAPNPWPIMVVAVLAAVGLVIFSRRPGRPPPPSGGSPPSPGATAGEGNGPDIETQPDAAVEGEPPHPPQSTQPPRHQRHRRHRRPLRRLGAPALAAAADHTVRHPARRGRDLARRQRSRRRRPSVGLPGSSAGHRGLGTAHRGVVRPLALADPGRHRRVAGHRRRHGHRPGPHGECPARAATDVKDRYEHGAGVIELHLEEVSDIDALAGRTIEVDANVGQVIILVPTSIDATIDAEVTGGGDIEGLPDVEEFGHGEAKAKSSVDDEDPDVAIDISLRFGQVKVRYWECRDHPIDVPAPGQQIIEPTGASDVTAACN